ncbi:MAG: right-handed parallel beta-helix repeat-containing protein [Chthonomonas sp.]|nr:right-handed parallel beta-helix repeat-containing protein [Chthonomonas sp.]
MRGGVYRLPTGIEYEGEDGAPAGETVTIRNYAKEIPYIRGSIEVNNFVPLSDPIASALIPSEAHQYVKQANLLELGTIDLGTLVNRGIPTLWKDGAAALYDRQQPCQMAGYPNAGEPMLQSDSQGANFVQNNALASRIAGWGVLTDAFVHGYLGNDFADAMLKILLANPINGRIDLANASYYGYMPGARFRVENVLAELDSPGEYYIDRARGLVFYYPISRTGDIQCELSVSNRTMVRVLTPSNLHFEGLVVEQGWRHAFEVINSPNTVIRGCTLRNFGNMGAFVRSPGNQILSSDVYNVGSVGVYVIGGTRSTLTRGDLKVDNCRIWNFGQGDWSYSPGIKVEGVGQTITRNSISDGRHYGVFVEGNDHLVEGNDFYNLATDTLDSGALAFNRDWTHRGNVVRRNRFRNIYDRHRNAINDRRSDTWGIYLDDCISGMLIEQNIFVNVGSAWVIGGGRDNVIRNNVINNLRFKNPYITDPMVNSWHCDSRLLTPNSYPGLWESLNTRLANMPYQNALWTSRYPTLANILNDSPREAKNNSVTKNVYFGQVFEDPDTFETIWYSMNLEANAGMFGIADNFYGKTNPGFRNPEAGNYNVVPFSKAARAGLTTVNTSLIGPYNDEWREGRTIHPLP